MRTRTSAATIALLLILPAAALAKGPGASIRAVLAAAHTTPGEQLPVDVRIKKTGRARAAVVSFYLSANAVRDKGDVRLAGGAKTRGRRITAAPQVPAAQPLGTFHLIACVASRCRAAKQTVEVTGSPVGSSQLIDSAVAAKKLTPQQGLYYRALAAFGDARLPARYEGDGSKVDHGVVRELLEQWPALSPAQQGVLNPYFTPPPARGAHVAMAAAATNAPTCDPQMEETVKTRNWRSMAMPNGHVRVWWPLSMDEQIGPRMRSFVAEIENRMWPRLVGLLGREPMLDGKLRCYHGLDDKLDIYMSSLDRRTEALTIPYPPNCTATPTFIVFNIFKTLPTNWSVAHELFHAFQFAYKYKGDCKGYAHWDEAAATWAGDYLYPKDDREHGFRDYMNFTHVSLADVDYDGWVFPYAMTQLHGVGLMKAIYEQTEAQPDALHAIDAAVPGGFKEAWPEFARVAWNQDPIETSFRQWDRFDARPSEDPWPTGPYIVPWHVGNGDAGQTEVDVQIPEKPLSRVYRAIKFDPDVRMVQAVTPYNTNLHVDAIMKFADGTEQTEDWEKRRGAMICPESPSQRLESLVLIASNTSMDASIPADPKIKVVASNIGCASYTGTITGNEHVHWTNVNTTETWTAHDLVFKRHPYSADNAGVVFDLVGGSVTWSISGVNQDCQISASAEIPIKPDGSMGDVSIGTWLGDHPTRNYTGIGYNLPQVKGTWTCKTGTSTGNFQPHTFFNTEPLDGRAGALQVPADGILDGGFTEDEHAGGSRDATYHWHLVPTD
jgi:hypothetical protein